MVQQFLPQFGGQQIGHHHGRTIPPEHKDKFTFAVVRNPYDRMLSVWHHLQECDTHFGIPAMEFPVWMEFMDAHWGYGGWNQVRFLEGIQPHGITVLKYENLAADVLRKLPFNNGREWPANRINTSNRPRWWEEMKPEWVNIIRAHSEPDFEEFGYSFKVEP
jgi:hypothetical protein